MILVIYLKQGLTSFGLPVTGVPDGSIEFMAIQAKRQQSSRPDNFPGITML